MGLAEAILRHAVLFRQPRTAADALRDHRTAARLPTERPRIRGTTQQDTFRTGRRLYAAGTQHALHTRLQSAAGRRIHQTGDAQRTGTANQQQGDGGAAGTGLPLPGRYGRCFSRIILPDGRHPDPETRGAGDVCQERPGAKILQRHVR